MIHFYSADTNIAWYKKPFNLSWLIKVFTHFEFPELSFDETFTHVSIGEDQTIGGKRLIFQSSLTQELNVYDNPKCTAYLVCENNKITSIDIFWDIVASQISKPYAFLQLIDFVRVWYWNKLFKHDPKNVWFPQNRVCSEQGYASIKNEADKYNVDGLSARLLKYNSNLYSPMRLYRVLKEAEKRGEVIFEVK
jgi:hypothetical protein